MAEIEPAPNRTLSRSLFLSLFGSIQTDSLGKQVSEISAAVVKWNIFNQPFSEINSGIFDFYYVCLARRVLCK